MLRIETLFINPFRRPGLVVSFFHPYCDAGGGGERVLWVAIIATAKRFQAARFLVYTGDLGAAPDQVLVQIIMFIDGSLTLLLRRSTDQVTKFSS